VGEEAGDGEGEGQGEKEGEEDGRGVSSLGPIVEGEGEGDEEGASSLGEREGVELESAGGAPSSSFLTTSALLTSGGDPDDIERAADMLHALAEDTAAEAEQTDLAGGDGDGDGDGGEEGEEEGEEEGKPEGKADVPPPPPPPSVPPVRPDEDSLPLPDQDREMDRSLAVGRSFRSVDEETAKSRWLRVAAESTSPQISDIGDVDDKASKNQKQNEEMKIHVADVVTAQLASIHAMEPKKFRNIFRRPKNNMEEHGITTARCRLVSPNPSIAVVGMPLEIKVHVTTPVLSQLTRPVDEKSFAMYVRSGPAKSRAGPLEVIKHSDRDFSLIWATSVSGFYSLGITCQHVGIVGGPLDIECQYPYTTAGTSIILPPQEMRAGTPGVVRVLAGDQAGNPRTRGGEDFNVSIRGPAALDRCILEDHSNGRYHTFVLGHVAGTYEAHITFKGEPVKNSPMKFKIVAAPAQVCRDFSDTRHTTIL
jgi:hypothetical protein